MYLLDQYRGTSVSCRYSIPARLVGPKSQNELVRVVGGAISDVILKHGILQVGIADAGCKYPAWVQLEPLNLRQHITWCFNDSQANLDSILQGITADEVDATYYEIYRCQGWRITVIHPQQADFVEIIFTWNHPHCDGVSGKIFHANLLESLNAATRGDNAQNSIHDSSVKLTPRLRPPIEEIYKLPLTLPYVLKTLWEERDQTALTAKPTQSKWAPIPSLSSSFKTQVRAFTLEADALEKVLLACHQQNHAHWSDSRVHTRIPRFTDG